MKTKRALRFFVGLLIVTLIMLGACSRASGSSSTTASRPSYPTKPIQLISPSAAGGDLDYDNRLFAQFMTKELGVNMVVSNVSGAGSVTGMKQVLDSAPDGYTVVGSNSEGFFPKLIGATDIGVESFKMVGIYATDSMTVVLARGDLPGVKDLPTFVQYARANPGSLEYGMATGSSNHMTGFALNTNLGIDTRFVDVGNNAQKLTALLGKQIDYCILTYQLGKEYIDSGEFIFLALLDNKRPAYIPDAPLLSDFGYKDVEYVKPMWIGMPSETPDDVVETFAAAMKRVVENPDFRAECARVGVDPVFYGPKEAYDVIDKIRASSFAPFAEDMIRILGR